MVEHDLLVQAALREIERDDRWERQERWKDLRRLSGKAIFWIGLTYGFIGALYGIYGWLVPFEHSAECQRPVAWLTVSADAGASTERWSSYTGGLQAAGAIVAGFALVAGFVQWEKGRHEATLEKYYERLKDANDRFERAEEAKLQGMDSPAGSHAQTVHRASDRQKLINKLHYSLFVFAELDNLEYILEKHCSRYAQKTVVSRALRHFSGRCENSDFRESVLHWVGRFDDEDYRAGYQKETRQVARYVVYWAEAKAAEKANKKKGLGAQGMHDQKMARAEREWVERDRREALSCQRTHSRPGSTESWRLRRLQRENADLKRLVIHLSTGSAW